MVSAFFQAQLHTNLLSPLDFGLNDGDGIRKRWIHDQIFYLTHSFAQPALGWSHGARELAPCPHEVHGLND